MDAMSVGSYSRNKTEHVVTLLYIDCLPTWVACFQRVCSLVLTVFVYTNNRFSVEQRMCVCVCGERLYKADMGGQVCQVQ